MGDTHTALTARDVRTGFIVSEVGEDWAGPAFDRWLAARDAEKWNEGAMWTAVELVHSDQTARDFLASVDNPYRPCRPSHQHHRGEP
jgi:hypothetical protein